MLTVKMRSIRPHPASGENLVFEEIVTCERVSTHWSGGEDQELGAIDTMTVNCLRKDGSAILTIGPEKWKTIYVENLSGKTIQSYHFGGMLLIHDEGKRQEFNRLHPRNPGRL